ncbi:MAG: pantoate--beta-alanine ligase [Gammaproteobacteria bacterium]|nr:pantoate--beta-alanine ligase [Gammaproteobacteria bacterium]MBT8133837.1 pantoate--beta-alanine ligase [Gammaproteobacteria bacterium]NNJ51267.1 pantoate--beta-alanine ligase [Gammaproteobacteria bacterium]
MDICRQVDQLRTIVDGWRMSGETIAFVPTMGNLHSGHLSLVELAQQRASRVVVSIYVNPMQFSPDEDFDSYPRTLDDDLEKLRTMDVDLVFTPDDAMIYPQGESRSTFIEVPGLSDIIEGEFRPGFFRGVATVVMKLFNMVQPDIAVFGEKDYQQLLVIRQMVADLNLPIEIIGVEIKREADGLAMSSRNNYLDAAERENSRVLSESLQQLSDNIEQGMSIEQAESECHSTLASRGFIVDYVTIRETESLKKVSNEQLTANTVLIALAAARLGKTRLIDNLKFSVR